MINHKANALVEQSLIIIYGNSIDLEIANTFRFKHSVAVRMKHFKTAFLLSPTS